MPKANLSEKRDIAKRELQGRGFVVEISARRDGSNLIGKIQVSDAKTDQTVARLIGVAKVDDLDVVLGIDAEEGIARDLLSQAMTLADVLRHVIPGITIKEEWPESSTVK